ALLGIVLAIGCDSASFNGGSAGHGKATDDETPTEGDSGKTKSEESSDGDKGSDATLPDGIQKEVFHFGKDAPPPPVDFVIVFDNSVSMAGMLSKTTAGFRSLGSEDVFPPNSKIAV